MECLLLSQHFLFCLILLKSLSQLQQSTHFTVDETEFQRIGRREGVQI